MVPTSRALQLHAGIADGLEIFRITLEGPRHFELATLDRHFRIALSEWTCRELLPVLMHHVRRLAPRVSLQVISCAPEEVCRRVAHGDIDLGVGIYRTDINLVMAESVSVARRFLCIVDRQNPALRDKRILLRDYLELPHVVVGISEHTQMGIDQALDVYGYQRRVVLTVPHFSLVPLVVRGTDMIGHCTAAMLDASGVSNDIAMVEPPIKFPENTRSVIWKRGTARDVELRWLRELIVQLVRSPQESLTQRLGDRT